MTLSTIEILILLPAKIRYWIREIKRSPDTMKAAAILVCRLNLSFKLFPLSCSPANISSTAVESRMVVLAKTTSSWPLNTLNQAFALQ